MLTIYVAGPFRGPHHWAVAQNVERARAHAYKLAQAGAVPLCPHSMFEKFDGTLDDQFWLDGTLELLKRCDAIAMIPGWEASNGSCGELKWAEENKLPAFYFGDVRSEAALHKWLVAGQGRFEAAARVLAEGAPKLVARHDDMKMRLAQCEGDRAEQVMALQQTLAETITKLEDVSNRYAEQVQATRAALDAQEAAEQTLARNRLEVQYMENKLKASQAPTSDLIAGAVRDFVDYLANGDEDIVCGVQNEPDELMTKLKTWTGIRSLRSEAPKISDWWVGLR